MKFLSGHIIEEGKEDGVHKLHRHMHPRPHEIFTCTLSPLILIGKYVNMFILLIYLTGDLCVNIENLSTTMRIRLCCQSIVSGKKCNKMVDIVK